MDSALQQLTSGLRSLRRTSKGFGLHLRMLKIWRGSAVAWAPVVFDSLLDHPAVKIRAPPRLGRTHQSACPTRRYCQTSVLRMISISVRISSQNGSPLLHSALATSLTVAHSRSPPSITFRTFRRMPGSFMISPRRIKVSAWQSSSVV